MNISFSKLGEEECEVCLMHETHRGRLGETDVKANSVEYVFGMLINDVECRINGGALYRDYIKRSEYRKDCEKSTPDDIIKVAVDMQKVLMLPRISEVPWVSGEALIPSACQRLYSPEDNH